MSTFAGLCQGGPYDGKRIYHGEPSIKVAISNGRVITYFGPPTNEISIGEYRHDGKGWVWQI